jgi:hypothetical protein
VLFAPLDANKAELRARFSALLADTDALDYIDYTKGLDSRVRVSPFSQSQCYLRLTTHEHDYFTSNNYVACLR